MTAADRGVAGAREFAPAKVNLYLHLVGRRADGYHLLDSLAVFPRLGDWVSIEPGQGLSLRLKGPFAGGLSAGADNLVLKAAAALAAHHGIAADASLILKKNLPAASGIGGGSSDAAAALRLLSSHWGVPVPDGLPLRLGADVPVCLGAPAPQFMAGIGERLGAGPMLPPGWMVLVNPGLAVETAAVFGAIANKDNPPAAPAPARLDFAALIGWLAHQRNDMEAAARSLCPVIGEVLGALADAPLARMSGSGATCFALHDTQAAAEAQAARVSSARSEWWVAAAPLQ
ncbi:MAG: 4-(cytidine 5'-diphospho)-2-C-methyl-D-erythritol kinase [Paracoccaceae bacterium]|nr:4-(cytidine 5'-diphospho)-2-C-methyl-D-erythritol kinase [Paracoccaceae bacterium]